MCRSSSAAWRRAWRRFAHYDYWEDKVRRSILFDSGADMLVYGMGEYAEREIAKRLKKKIPVSKMTDIKGTAYLTHDKADCAFDYVELPSFKDVCESKRLYADATRIEYEEHAPRARQGDDTGARRQVSCRKSPCNALDLKGARLCRRASVCKDLSSHVRASRRRSRH